MRRKWTSQKWESCRIFCRAITVKADWRHLLAKRHREVYYIPVFFPAKEWRGFNMIFAPYSFTSLLCCWRLVGFDFSFINELDAAEFSLATCCRRSCWPDSRIHWSRSGAGTQSRSSSILRLSERGSRALRKNTTLLRSSIGVPDSLRIFKKIHKFLGEVI